MNHFEIEEAWGGYNMQDHVEYSLASFCGFEPEENPSILENNVTTFEENMR